MYIYIIYIYILYIYILSIYILEYWNIIIIGILEYVYPRCSMYGIFTSFYPKNHPNADLAKLVNISLVGGFNLPL